MNTNQPLAALLGIPGVQERLPVFGGEDVHIVPQEPSAEYLRAEANVRKLGRVVAEFIKERDYLLNRSRGEKVWTATSDTDEIRSLCGKAAVALGPVIGEAQELRAAHERKVLELKVKENLS